MTGAMLIVLMEPPAPLEEEFNDWYDREHFPQRKALPGFQTGERWVCIEGWPRYLARYDLDGLDALKTPAYCAVSGENSTPWSKRVLPRTVGRQRLVLKLDHRLDTAPARSDMDDPASLCLIRWQTGDAGKKHSLIEASRSRLEAIEGLMRADWASDSDGSIYLAAEFDHLVTAGAFDNLRRISGTGSRMMNIYVPYRR